MNIHYYLDWFHDKGFSEKLVNVLQEDVTDRKSLVMISADSPEYKDEPVEFFLMTINLLITARRRKRPNDSFKTPRSSFYVVEALGAKSTF
ncbi:hypothetical protein [Gorillibacterium sp. CAU 1737]|uniref:hypothetical protein n=1 Tax=Gorillibacterium sp. CAU 1737 TaxID=3140362 RepID=UPI003261234E